MSLLQPSKGTIGQKNSPGSPLNGVNIGRKFWGILARRSEGTGIKKQGFYTYTVLNSTGNVTISHDLRLYYRAVMV
jgi:hypothetical protein